MKNEDAFVVLERMILCMAAVFVLFGAYANSNGDTTNSRLATVVSLVHFGSWQIDRPLDESPIPFEQDTIDKVKVNGRLLSSKPPVLPLLMTAEYVALRKLFGWNLISNVDCDDGETFCEDSDGVKYNIRVMSLTLIGGSYFLALIFFLKSLTLLDIAGFARVILLFSLAFCTQLWGYASNINNHVPGAGMAMMAVYFALGIGSGRLAPTAWRFALFGFAAAMTFTLDMPVTIFPAFAGLWLLWRFPVPALLWGGLGAFGPLALHFAATYAATGGFMPVQTNPEAYLYEGSYWRNPQCMDALNEPKGTYLFHMLIGRHGLFSLFPVLGIGLAGALVAIKRKDTAWRGWILGALAAFFMLTVYYLKKTNNYGGEAYGFRWFIGAMPILLLMGAPLIASLRARWKWWFVCFMIAVSFYSAFECAKSPWGANREWTCQLFLGGSYGHVEK